MNETDTQLDILTYGWILLKTDIYKTNLKVVVEKRDLLLVHLL